MMMLASGLDLITLFLGIEVMSIALYILAGFRRDSDASNEAAMKYFLLGAFASACLLYGIALTYGATGTTNLVRIADTLANFEGPFPAPMLLAGVALVLVGFGFKVAAAPFHMWAPDAYEGAPTPVTAYLSVGSKAASFAFLLRIFMGPLAPTRGIWEPLLAVVAVASMTVGNVAAMTQSNVKRLLAYSSISHAGYILLGLVAGNETGIQGVLVYVLVYTFMNLGAFLVIVALRRKGLPGEDIDDFAGLVQKSPGYAFLMLIFLLSLAGIPPTAGFIGKYFIFLSLIQTGHYYLAVIATLYVAVAIYYYFRIVRSMFVGLLAEKSPMATSFGLKLALVITGIMTLAIGIYPQPFLTLAQFAPLR
jgi:NADH-quinone oxidoreductase subunit N